MDVEILSRLQFAITIGFHYIYPPLSIGLGVILVMMEGMYIKTRNPLFEKMTKFWVKIFALTFGLGVASGIVMEFQFGTNWATYSRFVGDVFGSALAAEGIFAFFLESGFLAILVFGWDKVSSGVHFLATILVAAGAHFSAVWIIVANSWMQTPAGHHIVGEGTMARAEIVDFWEMVFNPSTVERLTHTVSGAWLAGAFLVLSVAAYYLIKKKHVDFAKNSIKIALVLAVFASLFQLFTGHQSAHMITEHQPAKLAALEGHYKTGPADMYLVGWVDEKNEEVYGIKIPGMLSWLVNWDTKSEVMGLDAFKQGDRPPVNIVFQAYHIMVGIGMLLILISLIGIFYWWRGNLEKQKWFLMLLVPSVLLPQIANQLGWIVAEVGRQPWIVYNILRTKDALSKSVDAGQVGFSITIFSLIYILLFVLFLFLLDGKIKAGPEKVEELSTEYEKQKEIFNRGKS
ncbi:MAG: cytochrome ubiquinol oxidase subunit I [Candidatus Kapaibacterium sp.]